MCVHSVLNLLATIIQKGAKEESRGLNMKLRNRKNVRGMNKIGYIHFITKSFRKVPNENIIFQGGG